MRSPALPLSCPARAPAWRLVFAFALLALFLRVLIPPGYMPGASDGGQPVVTLCTASGVEHLLLLDMGKPAKPAGEESDQLGMKCPYALTGEQAALVSAPVPHASQMPRLALVLAPYVYRALPILPPLGPPLGARAPPAFLSI